MYLIANNERIECTKAEKGADFINVYDDNSIISAFLGISNFSGFSVEGGDFTIAPLDDITQLQLAIAELAELVVGGV
jgi:hypothetical protein